jgi:hypothetical protein
MNETEGYHVKQSKPTSERQRSHIFSHMWKMDPKDKCIHKYKHDQICIYVRMNIYAHTHMHNMFPLVGLFKGTWGRRERKRE